jgi:uncharacterized hydrophobic protein (TIGR00341 family)
VRGKRLRGTELRPVALRLVEMVLPQTHEGQVKEYLAQLAKLGLWEQKLDEDLTLFRVLVDSEQAEPVLHEVERRFAHQEGFRVWLLPVEATLPRPEDQAKGEAAATEEGPGARDSHKERLPCAELVEEVSQDVHVSRTFLITVILSTMVAAIGLVRDNVAIIVGAMVIAPLLRPNMALALATTLGDPPLARRSMAATGAGLAISLVVAVLAGVAVPVDRTVREIASRATVGIGDVTLALVAGSAGALAFTSGVSAALVGVMVAVALLPPLVAAGLLLGSGETVMALQALLLLATNIICVNLAGVATFLIQSVRPRAWWDQSRAKRMVRRAVTVWILLLGCLIGLIYASTRW